jgi:GntR family transcriptional regulator
MIDRLLRGSPVPLYHQIAEAIRNDIAVGRLGAGDRLPAVRAAATEWGVNLHTVRRAYEELEREGLVSINGARGTIVAGRAGSVRRPQLARFLESCTARARERFGLSPAGLGRLLLELESSPDMPSVHFLECSRTQSEHHCREIVAEWRVHVEPLVLGETKELPPGLTVATYFHYNDIRQQWPERLDDIRFLAIAPDASLAHELAEVAGGTGRLLVCEFDAAKAQNIAADLRALLPNGSYDIATKVLRSPARLPHPDAETQVLVAPRVWGVLNKRQRQEAIEIRYSIRAHELEALGRELGWQRTAGGSNR